MISKLCKVYLFMQMMYPSLFIRPMKTDLNFVRCTLQAFGDASGSRVNYRKSSIILIRGSDEEKIRVVMML